MRSCTARCCAASEAFAGVGVVGARFRRNRRMTNCSDGQRIRRIVTIRRRLGPSVQTKKVTRKNRNGRLSVPPSTPLATLWRKLHAAMWFLRHTWPEWFLAPHSAVRVPQNVVKVGDADMDTLREETKARLLATKGYRLKSEHRLLCDEWHILLNLREAEKRVHEAARPLSLYSSTARYEELTATLRETSEKSLKVEHQLARFENHELDSFENEALPQATFSVWGTMSLLERSSITKALEAQEFKDGAVLIKQGEPRDAFFIIVQGELSCTQRRDRCKVGPAPRRPFGARQRLSAPARQCASAPARQRASAPAKPRHSPGIAPACRAPVLRPARLCIAARDPERHQGPLAPRGFKRSIRATQAPISRTYTTGPAWTRPCSSETAC